MSTRADDLLLTQPALHADSTGFVDTEEMRKGGISSDDKGADSYVDKSETSSISGSRAPLAPRSEDAYTPGAAILNFLGLKKRKAAYDLDAVRRHALAKTARDPTDVCSSAGRDAGERL